MTSLEELRGQWQHSDRKLGELLRLNAERVRSLTLGGSRTALRRLKFSLVFELVTGALLLWFFGSFLGEHFREARFFVPALVMHMLVCASTGLVVWQLVLLGQLDFGGPVTSIQERLELLRAWRIKHVKWLVLLCPAVWAGLLIVVPQALIGVDVWAELGALYVWSNVLFGLTFLLLGGALCRRFSERMSHAPFVQNLMRDVAGVSLRRALERVASIREFGREDG